jgi:hypothetical protein
MIWIFRAIMVVLAYFFPRFRFGYGLFLIVLMQLIAIFCLFAAWADHTLGQPWWIVRNEIILAIFSSLIGWVLGIALMKQAKKHEAMIKKNLDEYKSKQKG